MCIVEALPLDYIGIDEYLPIFWPEIKKALGMIPGFCPNFCPFFEKSNFIRLLCGRQAVFACRLNFIPSPIQQENEFRRHQDARMKGLKLGSC